MKNFNKYSKENIHFYSSNAPEILVELIRKIKPKSIADFGCGDGHILYNLKKRKLLRKIKKIYAIDLSKDRLVRVKQNINGVKTICSDVCNVKSIKSNSIDLAISSQVIEHVKNDKSLLKEIYRTLKKEGPLYISSVIKKSYGWWIYKCNGEITCDPTHLREYKSKEEFYDLLESNGFKVNKINLYLFKPSLFNGIIRILVKKQIVRYETAIKSKIVSLLSKIKIPVFGYYIIEVVAYKK